jgi:rhodanese-related sulfurtransferase
MRPETTEQKCESGACSPLVCPMCEAATRVPHLLRAILLVFFSVVLAAIADQLNPRGIPWAISPGGRVGIPRAFEGQLPEVPAKVAFGMLQSGKVVFLDSREAKDFAADHIPGAVSLSMRDWGKVWPKAKGKLPRDGRYLLYCYGAKCGLSTRQGKRMLEEGYQHVTVLEHGWKEWTEAGYPTEQRPEGRAP